VRNEIVRQVKAFAYGTDLIRNVQRMNLEIRTKLANASNSIFEGRLSVLYADNRQSRVSCTRRNVNFLSCSAAIRQQAYVGYVHYSNGHMFCMPLGHMTETTRISKSVFLAE
jgi:hypothetical protein